MRGLLGSMERVMGIEPTTFSLGNASDDNGPDRSHPQSSEVNNLPEPDKT